MNIVGPMMNGPACQWMTQLGTLAVTVVAVSCSPSGSTVPSAPCACQDEPLESGAVDVEVPAPAHPKCDFGIPDPLAVHETLRGLATRSETTTHRVRVQGVMRIRFEDMYIRDIQTGTTYWLEPSVADLPGLIPCDGYFGVIEGKYDPGKRFRHEGGWFYEVSYARGTCFVQSK